MKKAVGRLEAPDDLLDAVAANDFDSIAITTPHASAAGQLPLHHSDPFDRMLIAQSLIEGLTLVSTDRAEILLIEPSATVNTGDAPGALTAERRVI